VEPCTPLPAPKGKENCPPLPVATRETVIDCDTEQPGATRETAIDCDTEQPGAARETVIVCEPRTYRWNKDPSELVTPKKKSPVILNPEAPLKKKKKTTRCASNN